MDETVSRSDRNIVVSLVLRVVIAIRSSFIAFVWLIGVLFLGLSVLLSGYVVPDINYGVVAGMSFIWGISALLYGVIGKVLLRLIGYS